MSQNGPKTAHFDGTSVCSTACDSLRKHEHSSGCSDRLLGVHSERRLSGVRGTTLLRRRGDARSTWTDRSAIGLSSVLRRHGWWILRFRGGKLRSCCARNDRVGTTRYLDFPELRKAVCRCLSAPLESVRNSLPLSSLQKSNRPGITARGAAGHEMTPCARVRGLLNRLPLICELSSEGPRSSTKCDPSRLLL